MTWLEKDMVYTDHDLHETVCHFTIQIADFAVIKTILEAMFTITVHKLKVLIFTKKKTIIILLGVTSANQLRVMALTKGFGYFFFLVFDPDA